MKQVFIKNGAARLEEIPSPRPGKKELLVQVKYSCISPGTERKKMINSNSKSLFKKVLEKPERVKKALNMTRLEGIRAAISKAKGDLDIGEPSGYSLSGFVQEIGENVKGYAIGDRVVCAGAEHAFHAEYVCVPYLLTARVPEEVGMNQASTVTLGTIALQGIRRAEVSLGESVAVIGLGALGLTTSLLLKNSACKVIGFDIDHERIKLARTLDLHLILNAAEGSPLEEVSDFTNGYGVDAVIITASSNDSGPIELASSLCRKKGRVVIVGDVGMSLNRKDWYPKELDLLISTSYGPGRYDSNYEIEGFDYPYAYVRWTENRNMAAYIECLRSGLDIMPLIREVYPISEVGIAYRCLKEDSTAAPLVLLDYKPSDKSHKQEYRVETARGYRKIKDRIRVAVIGPGNFAMDRHMPNLQKLKDLYQIYAIMGRQGQKAKEIALRYNANYATTDYNIVLQDDNVDLVFITTRHDLHAPLAIQAAREKKAIFVEKPMATTQQQLVELAEILEETKVPFMVGFNRRFSPLIGGLKRLLVNRKGPAMIYCRVNTNPLPTNHWVYSPEGGGRIVGEGCHFIDLLKFLISSEIELFTSASIPPKPDKLVAEDNFQITLKFKDGSIASLFYTSIGAKEFPKEYIEVFCDGKVITIDNYQKLSTYGSELKAIHTKSEEKGHLEELKQFAHSLRSQNNPPIPLKEMINTTMITLEIRKRLKRTGSIEIAT